MTINRDVTVPGDKSLSHRALMLAAAARGTSHLRGLLSGADCQSTAEVLRALGCEVPRIPADGSPIEVRSRGLSAWTAPTDTLDCANSGTTARLMMGFLAGRPFCSTITGDESLRGRPMRRITDPLSAMGAKVTELDRPDRLPLTICGGELSPLDYRSPKASAQIKSAILFAGLSGRVPVSVWEPVQSRDHSERMLQALGVPLRAEPSEDGWYVAAEPVTEDLPPLNMHVPGDPSSAAFLLAFAILSPDVEIRIRGVGVNPTRTGFLDAITRMGARVGIEANHVSGGEPIADLVTRPTTLRGIEVEAPEIPAMIDEIPVLACLAARAEGETRITGADELRTKESDRIRVVVENLRAIGAEADELPDGLVVRGSDKPLVGSIRAHHDHRIAMAFGVLAALPGNRIEIDDPDVADISYPEFWDTLRQLGGTGSPLDR